MSDEDKFIDDRHLGDGVYVSFDGHQIWLAANHHENKVVALEPRVVTGLLDYVRAINRKAGIRYFDID